MWIQSPVLQEHPPTGLPNSGPGPLLLDKTYPTRHFPRQPFLHGQSVPPFHLCLFRQNSPCGHSPPQVHSAAPDPQTHLQRLPHPSLTNVALFIDPLNHQFPFCYSAPNSSLCNVTRSKVTSHHAAIGRFFWCQGSLSKSLNTSASLLSACLPSSAINHL